MELWKDIPGFEGRYQASDLGRVRSVDHRVRVVPHGVETTRLVRGRVLKPAPHKRTGHLMVMLGRGNNMDVHVAVMRAFKGLPPDGHEVLHGDHDPANNRLTNLCYGTRSENLKMDYAAGRRTPVKDLVLHRWGHK